METYICGTGLISPQKTFFNNDFLSEIVEYESNFLCCIEPDYKDFLEPSIARRMGRTVKMSIATAKICLKDAGIEIPDAIVTGSALGCMEATENFLLSMINEDEKFLSPTPFMQSIHNAIGAQIALQLKCMNYNFTFVHRGFSFENAVLDGMMLLAEGSAENVLIGGHDEMTERNFTIYDNVGCWKKNNTSAMQLINSTTNGTIAGEGAAFFALSNQVSERNIATLKGIKTIYKPANQIEIENKISELLGENKLTAEDIDVVIYGISGDARFDHSFYHVKDNYFVNNTSTWYKHLCGEYQTSSGFAMWMAAMMCKMQTIPSKVLIGENNRKTIKHIIIYNSFRNIHHSLFLISRC